MSHHKPAGFVLAATFLVRRHRVTAVVLESGLAEVMRLAKYLVVPLAAFDAVVYFDAATPATWEPRP